MPFGPVARRSTIQKSGFRMFATKAVLKVAVVSAVILFAFWFRLYFQDATHWDRPIRADAGQYYSIGWNLVHHGVFSMTHPSDVAPTPDGYRGPGYPLLVALSIIIGGEERWYSYLLFWQAVMGALAVALTMAIARQWLSFPYAIAAGLLLAMWPHTVTLSGLVLTETFFGLMLLLGIYLLGIAIKRGEACFFALGGIIFGYAALINPMILLFPVILALLLTICKRRYALLFLICALVLPAIWAARGVTLDSGRTTGERLMENVLAGMEPEFDYNDTPAVMDARARVYIGVEMYKQDRRDLVNWILGRIEEKPAMYARWYLVGKPLRFWQWPMLGNGDIYVYRVIESPFQVQPFYRAVASLCSSLNPWLMAASMCFVLVFAAILINRKPDAVDAHLALAALMFIYATSLHTALTPDPRYATPFRSFEIMLALSLLAMTLNYAKQSRQSRLNSST